MKIDLNTSLKNNIHENSLTKTMKHFKLTVTSMTCHHLYITTPDDVTQEKVYEHWRNFDGGDFSHDTDGDWEYSDLYEVKKDEMDGFHVNWENGPQ